MSRIAALRRFGAHTRRRARRSWAPSLLRRVVRHRAVMAFVSLALVALSLAGIERRWADAGRARDAWGTTVPVLIVDGPVAAGAPVVGAVRLEDRPVAAVPSGAVAEVIADARASVDLVPGEVLLEDRLVGSARGLLPAGTVAVTVQVDAAAPHVSSGDVVDLWSSERATGRVTRVVQAVVVLERFDGQLTVAVPEDEVAPIASVAYEPLTVARR